MMRATFSGPALDGFAITEAASSVRLVVAWPGDHFEIPEWTGNEFLLADGRRPALRTFTPVEFRPDSFELDIDIVRHPGGAISDWVESAHPGDRAAISGPAKGHPGDASGSRCLILGDETAIPAIRQVLAGMPGLVPAEVHIEIMSADAELEIPARSNTRVFWHIGVVSQPGATMVAAARNAEIDDETRVWAAGEAAAIQAIRRHLTEECGLPRSSFVARGYWKDREPVSDQGPRASPRA